MHHTRVGVPELLVFREDGGAGGGATGPRMTLTGCTCTSVIGEGGKVAEYPKVAVRRSLLDRLEITYMQPGEAIKRDFKFDEKTGAAIKKKKTISDRNAEAIRKIEQRGFEKTGRASSVGAGVRNDPFSMFRKSKPQQDKDGEERPVLHVMEKKKNAAR